ncbi:MAG: alpha-glucosidase/alpha-galactosidase [Ruminococcaceae bacterium]|nr:alpha-glucosidase/alpha-galactosidase [Oscillospiraceae bacterium]
MNYKNGKVENIKIAYIGGGSRGWAWGLMSDLVKASDISGDVYLYDIDLQAAKNNVIIGNKYNSADGANTVWNYHATETIGEALTGADFVVISILPGTFDEMYSDVHTPEKYGIYQPVGDTAGPGGIVRAMRTIPMFEEIGANIKEFCPNAWVINYTNPMTWCVKALYHAFPEIKAFGCCHEVFGTQKLLAEVVKVKLGVEKPERTEIKVNPVAVNHFTWLTEATYRNIDLFPLYKEFCQENKGGYFIDGLVDDNWMNGAFKTRDKLKIDLFNKFGWIAAAGDRHLAEFCEGKWYLESKERVEEMEFGLTSVADRRDELRIRLGMSERMISGEDPVVIKETGEEGVNQIRALLGLEDLVTNVNIPNRGQIPNLPLGAVVETNAVFRDSSLVPVFAGPIPTEIYPLVSRICAEQEAVFEGIAERNVEKIFAAFANDALVTCSLDDARKLFDEMCENTKEYLGMYEF